MFVVIAEPQIWLQLFKES